MCHQRIGDLVVNSRAQEDDAFAQQARINVEGPIPPARLFDHRRQHTGTGQGRQAWSTADKGGCPEALDRVGSAGAGVGRGEGGFHAGAGLAVTCDQQSMGRCAPAVGAVAATGYGLSPSPLTCRPCPCLCPCLCSFPCPSRPFWCRQGQLAPLFPHRSPPRPYLAIRPSAPFR